MTDVFNDLDHRLSVVKRWAIAETIHKQSVSEHVFNVERMSVRIARDWMGIDDPEALFIIMSYAHHHDDTESLSGDLPTMVKPYFNEPEFTVDHADLVPPPELVTQLIKDIVKLADMLDGWWFLCVEHQLGNRYLEPHYNFEPGRIMAFANNTWPNTTIPSLVQSQIDSMRDAASIRHSKRGR